MGLVEIIVALVTVLLGGGLLTAGVTLYKAKKHTGVEKDNLIVTGAQGAILTMEKALAAETARAERAELEASKLRTEKEMLLAKIDTLKAAMEDLQEQLEEIKDVVINSKT